MAISMHCKIASKPNFSTLSFDKVADLMGVWVNGYPTLCSLLVFSPYPQVYYPQLCITAVRIAGTEIGDLAEDGQRFIDNKRIEGNLRCDSCVLICKLELRLTL